MRTVSPPASVYTRAYYLDSCEGGEAFSESGGTALTEARKRALDRAGALQGAAVLDIGCGRGELVRAAAARGAKLAVGIDFSPDALSLASRDAADRVRWMRGDARALPVRDGAFDVALCTDVIEHLVPGEAAALLGEVHRVLRPGGRLVLHTTPNRWWQRCGYYVFYALSSSYRRRYHMLDARTATADPTHVNEQSPRSLAASLRRAGFSARVQVEEWSYAPESRLKRAVVDLLTQRWPMKLVCGNHLFALGRRLP